MRTVQLYIDNLRVDLFKDEEIVVTSSIQNVKDISKVFTDFTQTFTVPCTPNNNAIFDHFYNNDVDGTFKAKVRAEARIEINDILFRKGKVQLEGAGIKNGQAEHYNITFYGDVVTLKDLFGEDKLKDLDYSSLAQLNDGATVQASITTTGNSLDVRYPLISSSRVWTYGDAAATDISVAGNAIGYGELFPAVKDAKIFDLIESKYGVTFEGNFLTDSRFTSCFTWWKNRETANFTSEPIDLTFNAGHASCSASLPSVAGISQWNMDYIDMQTYTYAPTDWASWSGSYLPRHSIFVSIYNTTTSNTWYLDVYINGVLNNTISGSGDQANIFVATSIFNTYGLDDTYTFKMRAAGTLAFDFSTRYRFFGQYKKTGGTYAYFADECSFTGSGTITTYFDFNSSAPDMKIADWFAGTLKQYNLTCYPKSDTLTFQIEPLNDWYKFGGRYDITEYVDVKDIKVERVKLYNEINFDWEKSQSFMNEAYQEANNRQYGCLNKVFPDYDGGKYDIKLPFETLNFNNFSGQASTEDLQVGYCLTKSPDYKPYIPKPVKLYLYPTSTLCDFYLNDGSTNNQISSYMPFGQDLQYNTQTYSLNFNEEISSLTLAPIGNSLYLTYYYPYLSNLFNDKTRKVTVECMLPLRLLTELTLDDSVVIRDKQYRIDEMSTNLTTGRVRLVLLSDWRAKRKITFPIVGEDGGTIVVPIKPPKGGWFTISAPVESQFVTSTPTLPTTSLVEEQVQTVVVPRNSTGSDRQQTITYTGYNPDGTVAWTETLEFLQEGISYFLLQENNDDLLQEDFNKIYL